MARNETAQTQEYFERRSLKKARRVGLCSWALALRM